MSKKDACYAICKWHFNAIPSIIALVHIELIGDKRSYENISIDRKM